MVQDLSVIVDNITKKFTVKTVTKYGGITKSGTIQVLSGLSFTLSKGEVLGIIGKNGSGKSTILKLLTNIMVPDSGSIQIKGKVASILELGMGFDPESSGRDNIRIKCGLYGLSNKEIDECIEDIIVFSELGDQIDNPLRTYSSGMTAKLAFSVLMYVKCDVLIIDEVLSVGDAGFNSKCKLAFSRIKKSGRSIILASHNISIIESMCDRVLWIDNGLTREIGDPISICYHYNTSVTDSLDTVLQLANYGDVNAMNRVGIMYRDGITVQVDEAKAEQYFQKASDMGFVEAQINLADLKIKSGELEVAIELYQRAARSGNATAITSLINLEDSDSAKLDLCKEIRIEAEKGNMRAVKLLADMLYSGIVYPKNQAEAIEWYKISANNHNALSQFVLGVAYRDGIGVQKDSNEAIKWFTMASNHGNMRARVELANIYRRGIGVEVNISKCVEWLTLAANTGDSNSMLQLGTMYRDGQGVDVNLDLSNKWFKRYAMQGLINCEISFAELLKQGNSGLKQMQSFKWFLDAANRGSIKGMNNVAVCYRDGSSVIADSSKAADYYLKSAELLDPIANFELGMLFYKGNGVKQDVEKAAYYLSRAAFMGNFNAMLQLFYIQSYGGIKQSLIENDELLERLNEFGNYIGRSELYTLLFGAREGGEQQTKFEP